MSASKLSIYNGALLHFGERRLSTLTDQTDTRRALDDAWDDCVAFAIQRGFWNFAMRSVVSYDSPSVTPYFGYTYAVEKPDDWVLTYVISENERLDPPLLRYLDEAGFWYVDTSPVYVKYVSDDPAYGMDMSRWGAAFVEFVKARLARMVVKRITASDSEVTRLEDVEKKALAVALSRDAMDEPAGFPPRGTWAMSRQGGRSVGSYWNGQFTNT